MNNIIKKAKIVGSLRATPSMMHGAKFKKEYYDPQILNISSFTKSWDFGYGIKTIPEMHNKLSKVENWTTYSGNLDFELHFNESDFDLTVTVWDGELLDGERTKKRFTLNFEKLPYKKVYYFTQHINYEFDRIVEQMFKREERQRIENRLKEIEKELLA